MNTKRNTVNPALPAARSRASAATIRLTAWGLALCILTPCLLGQNTNSSFQTVEAAADKGDATAQYQLASFYANGNGVKQDDVKAADYLRKAAEQGYAPAQTQLGAFYGLGRGVGRDRTMAVSWYQKAADQGDAVAEYAMGNFCASGRGVKKDIDQAIKWWQKAADQNYPDAECALGHVHFVTNVELGTNYLNYPEAIRWLTRAAGHGSTDAMNHLAVAYDFGLGVKLDFKESARWYREAAECGNAQAQAMLGELYIDGRGVEYDPVQAYKWFKLSAMHGNAMGAKNLDDCDQNHLLTPKQLAEAEQLVLGFRPKRAPRQDSFSPQRG